MRKLTSRGMMLAALAGLAVSSAARAQFVIGPGTGTFTDISGTGTLVATGDDASGLVTVSAAVANAAFPAGSLSACTNGHAGYGSDTEYFNNPLPDATFYGGARCAAVYWDDLITQAGPSAGVYAQEITEGGIPVLIIQWNNMDHYSASPSTGKFELKIFGGAGGPNGALAQYLYSDIDFGDPANNNGASATIGYQNNGTSAFQFSYNVASITSGAVLALTSDTATGACCLPTGACTPNLTSPACTTAGGVWEGANSPCGNCPQPGACCLSGGACSFVTATSCVTLGGTFGGEGIACAAANCPKVYRVDDGSAEDAIGLTAGGAIAFANQFTSVAGSETITQVEIVFGTPATLNGAPVTVYLWSDPNGDGDPTDAQVLASVPGVISNASANVPIPSPTWVTFNIPDTTIPAGTKFFVGWVMQTQLAGQFPCALDYATPHGNSWIGYDATPGAFNPNAWANVGELTAIGLAGNWLIRADATGSAPACYANCDQSTNAPCLNVLDFNCFLNKFAAQDTYANCDNSTNPPVLNVLDFNCFLNKFAAGCSSC